MVDVVAQTLVDGIDC